MTERRHKLKGNAQTKRERRRMDVEEHARTKEEACVLAKRTMKDQMCKCSIILS